MYYMLILLLDLTYGRTVVHTHVPLSPSSKLGTSRGAAMTCDCEGNRRSDVELAMRHRREWFIHLRAQGLSKGDEHPTNTADRVWYCLPLRWCSESTWLGCRISAWLSTPTVVVVVVYHLSHVSVYSSRLSLPVTGDVWKPVLSSSDDVSNTWPVPVPVFERWPALVQFPFVVVREHVACGQDHYRVTLELDWEDCGRAAEERGSTVLGWGGLMLHDAQSAYTAMHSCVHSDSKKENDHVFTYM